jgi:hypothetical protein
LDILDITKETFVWLLEKEKKKPRRSIERIAKAWLCAALRRIFWIKLIDVVIEDFASRNARRRFFKKH